MRSRGAGSYEFKRLSWMQIDECSARLARSTSDGSADDGKRFHFSGSAERFVKMGSAPNGGGGSGGRGGSPGLARAGGLLFISLHFYV